jgi:serine phosphatase RsbU (regulator of sigma subunit)
MKKPGPGVKTEKQKPSRAAQSTRALSTKTIQRYRREMEQRHAEIAIISAVQEALASRLELQAIYDLVGDKVREIFDAQSVTITTYDPSTETTQINYSFEKGKRFYPAHQPFSDFARYLIDSRRVVVINEDFIRRGAEFGMRVLLGEAPKSGVWVPFVIGGTVRGGISLQNVDRENAFGESDVRLLTILATSMGVALENARLFDELEKRNREISEALDQQTATSEILRVIASSPSEIKPILDAVAENAARLCTAHDVQIYQVDGNLLRQVTHYGPLPALRDGEGLPLVPGLITGRAVIERRTIHTEDVQALSESDFPDSVALQRRLGHRTTIATPLVREGIAIGAVVVRRNEVRPFTEKQIMLLKTFADQAAIAIENVRLFNETQRLLKETEQRAAELQIINSVQEGLAAQLDMQAVYDLVGDKTREFFDAQVVVITTFDSSANLIYTNYLYEDGKRFFPPPYQPSHFAARLIASRQSTLVRTRKEFEKLGSITTPGTAITLSGIFVPLMVGEQFRGGLSLQNNDREYAFDESDVRLLETFASSMSVALENARLRDKERIYLKGLERELEIGRQIQFSFLPDELPELPGWEIAARFLPARQVSGDMYDVFALQGDGTIGLVIADVCDKGVGAALYMALFRSLIRATFNLDYFGGRTTPASGQAAPFDPNDSLKNAVMLTNNYIARTHEQANMFATVFFGVLDPATGVLSYINGGHEPPIIFGAGGVKSTLVRTGMAVGLMPDIPFGIAETHLEPGDTLLALTDGVVDAQNPAAESFGREKLISLLTPPAGSAAALIDRIEISLREHIAGTDQFDDITLLAVGRRAS